VGAAFILVSVALALVSFFVYFSFIFSPWRSSPQWIFAYDAFLGGPVLLASVLVWAFPFAAVCRRNKVFPAGLGGWVFLDGSSPRLPQQEPLRLREALTIGVILGMIFWFLWEAEYFAFICRSGWRVQSMQDFPCFSIGQRGCLAADSF
jgi:hypothetical protein